MTTPATFEIETVSGPVTIRPTSERDTDAYRDLRLEALREHPSAFGSDYEESLTRPPEHWAERARLGAGGEHGVAYVAEAAGTLVGMTVLFRDEAAKMRHGGSIVSVYVQPGWRSTGIADALIEACIDWAGSIGVRLVKLGVATNNIAAIRLYARLGFEVYGVDPQVIRHDDVYHDELLMVRRIE